MGKAEIGGTGDIEASAAGAAVGQHYVVAACNRYELELLPASVVILHSTAGIQRSCAAVCSYRLQGWGSSQHMLASMASAAHVFCAH